MLTRAGVGIKSDDAWEGIREEPATQGLKFRKRRPVISPGR